MPGEYKQPQSFCVMLRPKNAAEPERIFNVLAEEGDGADTHCGDRLGASVRQGR
jgi:hypothetical protein